MNSAVIALYVPNNRPHNTQCTAKIDMHQDKTTATKRAVAKEGCQITNHVRHARARASTATNEQSKFSMQLTYIGTIHTVGLI